MMVIIKIASSGLENKKAAVSQLLFKK